MNVHHLTKKEFFKFVNDWWAIQRKWDAIKCGQHCFYTDIWGDCFHHEVIEVDADNRRMKLKDHSLDGKIVEKGVLPSQDFFANSIEELMETFPFQPKFF